MSEVWKRYVKCPYVPVLWEEKNEFFFYVCIFHEIGFYMTQD